MFSAFYFFSQRAPPNKDVCFADYGLDDFKLQTYIIGPILTWDIKSLEPQQIILKTGKATYFLGKPAPSYLECMKNTYMIPQVVSAIIKWLEKNHKDNDESDDDNCDDSDGDDVCKDKFKEDDIDNDDAYDEMLTYLTEGAGIDWCDMSCSQFVQSYSYMIFDLCKK